MSRANETVKKQIGNMVKRIFFIHKYMYIYYLEVFLNFEHKILSES